MLQVRSKEAQKKAAAGSRLVSVPRSEPNAANLAGLACSVAAAANRKGKAGRKAGSGVDYSQFNG